MKYRIGDKVKFCPESRKSAVYEGVVNYVSNSPSDYLNDIDNYPIGINCEGMNIRICSKNLKYLKVINKFDIE